MDNGAGDFVAFGMRQGAAEFRFDVGSGPAIIRSRDVALNKWNTVRLKRDRKQGSLYIKGREFRGTAPGKFEGLDLINKMYVGGVLDYGAISKQAGFSSGFVGGISRFEIRGLELDLGGAAIEKVGVGDYPVCQGNPCMNGGVCQAAYTLHGYKCTCPKGYSGQRCQLRGERCFPGACGDKGRCYDLLDNRGYRCACPVGRTGARCEKGIVIQKLSFNRTSFVAYPVIQDALLKLQINLTFKANALHDGILLYNAQTQNGKGHFLALVLRNGSVEFRYASGDGASSGKSRGINLRQPMFLGGVDFQTRVAPGIGVNKGFTGCITEVILQGRKVNLVNNAIYSNNTVNCERGGQLPCSRKPCLNYGLCVPIGTTDYSCHCYPQFSGKNCEIPVDVCKTNNPCRNNGECTMEGRNVQCRCRLGYTGRVCQTATRPVRTAVRLQGDGYVELMGELLPHRSSPVREVVSMTVQTTARDALLFWHGQEPATLGRGRDYVAIAIVNGHGFFNFDLGSGPANITTMERINDGRPHKIMVTRTGRDGNIEIDGFSIINGRSGGILQVLNTKGNIYLGGVPDFDRMTGGMYKRGLVGCLSDVEIQNKGPLDLGREALGGRNVQPCT